jgi:hypothetical protein
MLEIASGCASVGARVHPVDHPLICGRCADHRGAGRLRVALPDDSEGGVTRRCRRRRGR